MSIGTDKRKQKQNTVDKSMSNQLVTLQMFTDFSLKNFQKRERDHLMISALGIRYR